MRPSAQLATTWCGRPGASAAPLTEVCPEVEVLSSEEPRRVTRETSVTGSMGRSSHSRSVGETSGTPDPEEHGGANQREHC